MEKKIIRLKEVDSTNTFLKNLDTYDEDALTIAIADYQTAGRGQGVHTWERLIMRICTSATWLSACAVASMAK